MYYIKRDKLEKTSVEHYAMIRYLIRRNRYKRHFGKTRDSE